ncbi:Cleavage/polyadenylation specificity factor, A subunit, C-terminal [Artemisia annua]|uniref:Cleavage/polyadenylation specificity factor, A subunit, C-terminal n=1 Tax=Artemisia annua TaxID=35608 RepID=A0A2U1N3A9_ARTAN|nr:Cleavage/polyadenylation specificity factor, A subunit, C-terminal [Artemisia annua]
MTISGVTEVYSKEMKGAISALASLQGYLLVASGPKTILHKWNGCDMSFLMLHHWMKKFRDNADVCWRFLAYASLEF